MIHKYLFSFLLIVLISINISAQKKPLRVGIAGLSHSHVHGILGSTSQGGFEIVGIAEPDRELAKRFSDQYGFPMSIVYNTINEMITASKPEAVTAFGSIYQHLEVVEACAPKGIHVMVEKPLAVNFEHAQKMADLAKKYNIRLLTNYETTWYPTNQMAYDYLKSDSIGKSRKFIINDGHKGPKKVGVNKEFLDWLTDPVLNGGGAIIDFGCYGVNLATWLMDGKKPNSVIAITQQLQPENNPKVDDESIIILSYDNSNVLVQGSWNWPIGRKDLEIYGERGAIYADNKYDFRMRISEGYGGYREETLKLKDLPIPYNDPFIYMVAVFRNEITPKPFEQSSLENNLIVMEILDAARQSAKTGKSVPISK